MTPRALSELRDLLTNFMSANGYTLPPDARLHLSIDLPHSDDPAHRATYDALNLGVSTFVMASNIGNHYSTQYAPSAPQHPPFSVSALLRATTDEVVDHIRKQQPTR